MSNDERAHIRLPAALKKQMLSYARRKNTTLSAITVQYFTDLLEEERRRHLPIDVEQV